MDTLQRYLEEMEALDKPLASSKLVNLSGLTPEEIARFQDTWERLGPERRLNLLTMMVELAQDNVEMDFDAVFRACLEDPDAEVRLKALDGMEDSDNRSLISPLIAHLLEDPQETVRARAASLLGEFVLQAELGHLPTREATRTEQALMKTAEEGPPEVRRRAVEALGPLSKEPVREIIRKAYLSPDPKERASAVYAMGRNCDAGWLPLLIKESRSPFPELRYEAARAMGEIEDQAAVPSLAALLRDDDEEVQIAAVEALGQVGGPQARRALQEAKEHAEPRLRQAAAEALAEQSFWEEPLHFG